MSVANVLLGMVAAYYGLFLCMAAKSAYDEEWCTCCFTMKQRLHTMKQASSHSFAQYYNTVPADEMV